MNTSQIGTVSEGVILATFVKLGFTVLIPFGNGARYDLAVDDGVSLKRVQCKTACDNRNGTFSFSTCSETRSAGGKRTRRDYSGTADLIAVYYPTNGKVYVIPVCNLPRGECTFRIEKPLNGQFAKIRWAKDFELL